MPPPRIPPSLRLEPIPDADSVANDSTLHGVELNRAINRTYVQLSEQIQRALDPQFQGVSQVSPSWYGMAIYASRGAGQGMLAAQKALDAVASLQRGEDPLPPEQRDLRDQALELGPHGGCFGAQVDEGYRLALGFVMGYQMVVNPKLLLDPRTLATTATRAMKLVAAQPGAPLARFERVARTIASMLEDGNRRIFRSIGVAAQRFLELRREGATPERVLTYFAADPQRAQALYQQSLSGEQGYPEGDTQDCLAVGFALYEQASREAAGERKNALIDRASNLMAYHEQKTVAVPAFLPDQTFPDEASREATMQILTPFVSVENRWGSWCYRDFAESQPTQENWLVPPACRHNWGHFEDRWAPILDYFRLCQGRPADLWPSPNPDPAQPV